MTPRKPRSSAVDLPAIIDIQWCAHEAARLLTEAESPIADSDMRDRSIALADAWSFLAGNLGED